jgi:hypothetical protein
VIVIRSRSSWHLWLAKEHSCKQTIRLAKRLFMFPSHNAKRASPDDERRLPFLTTFCWHNHYELCQQRTGTIEH